MSSFFEKRISKTIRRLVLLLVEKKYTEIAKWTRSTRLSEIEIGEAITEYGNTIILLSNDFFDELDIIEITESIPKKWSVVFPLWTSEEGRSDLSVEVTCIDVKNNDLLDLELDNIHVL